MFYFTFSRTHLTTTETNEQKATQRACMVTLIHHRTLLVNNNRKQRIEPNTKSIYGHSYTPLSSLSYQQQKPTNRKQHKEYLWPLLYAIERYQVVQGQLSLRQSRHTSYEHCPPHWTSTNSRPGVLRLLAKCCNVHLKLFRSRVQI